MKRKIFFIIAVFIPALLSAQTVEKPTRKHPASFAVITDSETFARTRDAVYEYRDAVQADGLAVYIVHADWKDPGHVRDAVKKLRRGDKTLEGILLLGDIPVVLVRNAQHMTTAFKMDEEKFPIQQSSVASDRFYDDLNLEFEFLSQDTDNPLHYYYNLRHDSPQRLDPALYSGRVMYPASLGGDKYVAISAFLRKAALEKTQAEQLDDIVTYAGDHYNSDDLTVWIDEKIALNEQFPLTDRDNTSSKQLNFRMDRYMKFSLFDELQRPEVDLFFFNEHGLVDKQQISPPAPVDSPEARMEALKSSVYYYIAREEAKEDGDPEGARRYYQEKYGLSDAFLADYSADLVAREQAEERKNTVIDLDDLRGFDQQPRVIVLHACYNGSFHKPGSVASYYIFHDGRTVAVQGNTVNVLQDKWAAEMSGLLSHGVRVGQWNRLAPTLEGHIIGDPTFRFRPVEENTLAHDLSLNRGNERTWREGLESRYADVVSVSLRMLADRGKLTSSELLAFMRTSTLATVRMECLKLLSRFRDVNFAEGVRLGLYDRYEVVRRNAAIYLSKMGDPSLLPAAADVYVNYAESQRVNYILQQGFAMFRYDDVKPLVTEAIRNSLWPDKAGLEEAVSGALAGVRDRKAKELEAILDPATPEEARISAIRSLRNNNYHEFVPQYLGFVEDDSQPESLRVMMTEALGWFTLSGERQAIIDACRTLIKGRNTAPGLKAELIQTVKRLE